MAVEKLRSCGYRKVNGLYLVGEGLSMACDRLPYELNVCPVCGAGVKFSRGFQWLDWLKYAGGHEEPCHDVGNKCPLCHPLTVNQPYGLLWVGESFYTPESFIHEAIQMGVSKRIAAIPKNLKLGETWVLFAHKKAIANTWSLDEEEYKSAVFYAFRPQRVELLIWQKDATSERLEELEKKGITPIVIPDGDIDHDPANKLKMTDEERGIVQRTKVFEDLRNTLKGGA